MGDSLMESYQEGEQDRLLVYFIQAIYERQRFQTLWGQCIQEHWAGLDDDTSLESSWKAE